MIIDKIVQSASSPSSPNTLWLDSRNKELKYKGNNGWETVGLTMRDVGDVDKDEPIDDATIDNICGHVV